MVWNVEVVPAVGNQVSCGAKPGVGDVSLGCPICYIETENWQPKGEPVSLSPILPRWFQISGLQTLWSRMPISISRSVALGEPICFQ